MSTVNLNDLLPNPSNPRVIKDHQYARLLDSIKRDPQFLAKRPIIHADGVILGGNMRFRALQEATRDADFRAAIGTAREGEVPAEWIIDASNWTEEQRQRFVIVDNSPTGMAGDWDWDVLANEWPEDMLSMLGMEMPEFDDAPSEPEEPEKPKTPAYITCPKCGHQIEA